MVLNLRAASVLCHTPTISRPMCHRLEEPYLFTKSFQQPAPRIVLRRLAAIVEPPALIEKPWRVVVRPILSWSLIVACFVQVMSAEGAHAQVASLSPNDGTVEQETLSSPRRNIILFIGDGMGFEHVQAGRLFANGSDAVPLSFEDRARFPFQGESITARADGGTTDSATAGTALATGYQHDSNGIISEADGEIKTTILELARDHGWNTGIVTTSDVFDATVASFAAHDDRRSDRFDIRLDYLFDDDESRPDNDHSATLPNLIFGGGLGPGFVDDDYIAAAATVGYQFVSTRTDLLSLTASPLALPPMVLGVFDRSTTNGMLISTYDRDRDRFPEHDEPELAELVVSALELLSSESTGFFLVVEDEHIDEISHGSFARRELQIAPQVASFDRAVAAALDWLDAHDASENTLVIVTSDHETGDLQVDDGQVISPGDFPTLNYGTRQHTDVNVPLYVTWPESVDGAVLDNTSTFFIMEDYLLDGVAPIIQNLRVKVDGRSTTLSWRTREPAETRVDFGMGTATSAFVADTRLVNDHEVVLTGLTRGAVYDFVVSSRDLAGFAGTTETSTFRTAGDPPPRPTGLAATESTAALRLDWDESAFSDHAGFVVYRASQEAGPYSRIDNTPELLIASGALWSFDDSGIDLGVAWRQPEFDDATWKVGAAQLGYGDGDETSRLSFGSDGDNKHPTYYFRRDFEVEDRSEFERLGIQLLVDDGAVVFLNGEEILRYNMPSGEILFSTFASETVGGDDEDTFFAFEVGADALVDGVNVLAVEVHQTNRTSSDVSFDLELNALPPALVVANMFLDERVLIGENLYYRIAAVDRFDQESPFSTPVCVSMGAPMPPTAVDAQAVASTIRIEWTPGNECDLAGYNVYRTEEGEASFLKLNPVPLSDGFYVDPATIPGVSYRYTTAAVDFSGLESEPSAAAAIVRGGAQIPGDCNQDATLDVADAICILQILFTGQPVGDLPPGEFACGDGSHVHPANIELLDFNDDEAASIDVADAIAMVNYFFLGGAPHVAGVDCRVIAGCADAAPCDA